MNLVRPIDTYFASKPEPLKSCLHLLRTHILQQAEDITEIWRYGMPFYCYKGTRFCYLWVHKKLGQPYIGIVDGNRINYEGLIQEKRARMKIYLLNAGEDVPVKKIDALLTAVLKLYKDGHIGE